MLVTYGSEINGLNSSIQQVISYMNLVEAGLALTAIQSLYNPLARKDWKSVNGILSATRSLYRKSGVVFLFVVIVVSFLYPLILNTEIRYINISMLIFVLAGGSVIEFFLNGKLRVLLMADQRSYVVNIFQSIALVLSIVLKVILINLGFNYIVVQLVGTIALLLRYVLSKYYVRHKYKEINYYDVPNNKALKNRWSVLFHQIAGLVVFNTPIIIVSIFVGLKEASVYSVYNVVFNGLLLIITMFSKSTVASFGNLITTERSSTIKSAFQKYQSVFFAFGIWIYTMSFILIESFIKLYTTGVHDANYSDMSLALLFIIVGFFNLIRVPSNTLIEASGHYKETQYRALIEALINVTASLILVQIFGIYGVLLGAITSYMYRSFDIIIYSSRKILKTSPVGTFLAIIPNAIAGIFFIGIFRIISINISNWFQWLFYAIIFGAIIGTLLLVLNNVFCKGLLADLKQRVRSIKGVKLS
jgi:O-antigen/teichoic acid export membrane protein